jgi:hypothetical protein
VAKHTIINTLHKKYRNRKKIEFSLDFKAFCGLAPMYLCGLSPYPTKVSDIPVLGDDLPPPRQNEP